MKKILLLFLLSCSCSVVAQNPEWVYLSKVPTVHAIREDATDIWIGSYAGLLKINKTNGSRTFIDKTNSPITDSWISSIVVDHSGNKWFGTWDRGDLIKYDNTNWTIFDSSNSILTGAPIKSLTVDSNNVLWLCGGFTNGGLIKFDGTTWTCYNTSNSGLPGNYVETVFADGNTIWMISGGNPVKFDGTTWTEYTTSNSNFSGTSIIGIDKDANGNIWFLHHRGIERFNGTTFTLFDYSTTNLPEVFTWSISIDTNNLIWVGASSNDDPGGLLSFNGSSWTKYDTTNAPIADEDVNPVYVDQSNNVWFGCGNTGMVFMKSDTVWTAFDASNSGLGNSFIKQIVAAPDGNVFIGTPEPYLPISGLMKYNWNSWTGLPNYDYYSIRMAIDHAGNLYIKSRTTGVMKFDGSNWISLPNTPPLQIGYPVGISLNAFSTDQSGGIWMDYIDRVESVYSPIYGWTYVPYEGLAHFDGTGWTTYNDLNSSCPAGAIGFLQIDDSNHVWFTSDSGLVKFDGVNWSIYNASNSMLPTNNIGSFVIDTLGNIWFSNGSYGFYKFDWTQTINYPHPTLDIYAAGGTLALDNDGSIWQYTLFDVIGFDGTTWSTFDAFNSPVPNNSNITALAIDKFGNKWIGTQFGVLLYKEGGVSNYGVHLSKGGDLIRVYPNPFDDAFQVEFGRSLIDVEITLFDLLSRPVYSARYPLAQSFQVSRGDLCAGIYFYQIASRNQVFATGKIIAE